MVLRLLNRNRQSSLQDHNSVATRKICLGIISYHDADPSQVSTPEQIAAYTEERAFGIRAGWICRQLLASSAGWELSLQHYPSG